MLWNDTIDNLSSYKVDGPAFHTMRYSSDHTMQVGFSFDTTQHSNEMWMHIERLISCPENISLSTPGELLNDFIDVPGGVLWELRKGMID